MAYVKKIDSYQFVLDCINKEFEIIESNIHFDNFLELQLWAKQDENKQWFDKYYFSDKEQFKAWKEYFMEHFYNWQPKRISKRQAENDFHWFSLQYGFAERWEE